MIDDLEVYCPECGRLFKGQTKMIRHLEKEHLASKRNSKHLILSLDSRYLGGHQSFPQQSNGVLSFYTSPVNKITFESDDFTFEISIYSIIETKIAEGKEIDGLRAIMLGLASPVAGAASLIWRKTNKLFYIQFQDEANEKETVIFDHSDSMDQFAEEVRARLPIEKPQIQQVAVTQHSLVERTEDPLHIIRVRFAKGEISKEQYEEMKKVLTS